MRLPDKQNDEIVDNMAKLIVVMMHQLDTMLKVIRSMRSDAPAPTHLPTPNSPTVPLPAEPKLEPKPTRP